MVQLTDRLERVGRRLAIICFHTSPLAQPGRRDAGGMNVYVRALVRELAALGDTVDVFTRATAPAEPVRQIAPGARLIAIPAGPARGVEKSRLPEYIDAFAEGIAAFRLREGARYDLIHSHYWLSGLAGLLLQRRWSVPHVTMFHTLGEIKNRARLGEREPQRRIKAERDIVTGANRIICATAHERSLLRDLYQASEQRTTVVPCGVDTELFRPRPRSDSRAQLGLDGRPTLLYVGRIEPLKGLDIALTALSLLEEPRPRFLIAGGDRYAAGEVRRLQALAGRLGVSEQVRFVGAVPQARLPLYYTAADVCLVPSYYESFGMVALEAQACGTPVVASRVGGLPGAVRDGETGYLVPWRCPEPFSERIDVLLRNRALREAFGASAREWALQFSWPTIARRIRDVYDAQLVEWSLSRRCHTPLAGVEAAVRGRHDRCRVA